GKRSLAMPTPAIPAASRRRAGFTLLEMMLVVLIFGILATVMVINLSGQSEKALTNITKDSLNQLKGALTQYNIENGTYPPALSVLVTTKGLERVPKDGWKHDFIYLFPGSSQNTDQPYDLLSPGKDNTPGTPDDVNVWTMEQR